MVIAPSFTSILEHHSKSPRTLQNFNLAPNYHILRFVFRLISLRKMPLWIKFRTNYFLKKLYSVFKYSCNFSFLICMTFWCYALKAATQLFCFSLFTDVILFLNFWKKVKIHWKICSQNYHFVLIFCSAAKRTFLIKKIIY